MKDAGQSDIGPENATGVKDSRSCEVAILPSKQDEAIVLDLANGTINPKKI